MNDVRNLMHMLGGDVDYKEFRPAQAAAETPGAWPLLKRLERVADDLNPAPLGAPLAAVLQPEPEPEPVLATQLRTAAIARSGRGGQKGFSLGQYAAGSAAGGAAPSLDDGRHLPLSDVFARLAQAAR